MINVPPAPAEKSKGHPFEVGARICGILLFCRMIDVLRVQLFVVDPSGASQSLSLNAPTHEDLFTVLAAVNRVLASTITSPLEASKVQNAINRCWLVTVWVMHWASPG